MLDSEAKENLQLIYETAEQLWGNDCVFSDIQIINAPWSEFELPMRLYGKTDIGIYYERSAVDIGIKLNDEYEILGKFTNEKVFRGMKAMEPENLRHNLGVLDKVVRAM
jgi:hypothetical protein